ncbi:MAG: FHA domain-containing protein [Myxococcales bacterium]|nr:FHA domain-containing protein [Myxococcales bacterium]
MVPDADGLLIRIESAPEGSPLQPGPPISVTLRTTIIGRSADADLVLMDPSVSRRHARLDLGPPATVEALTSSNGTFLDEVPLPAGTRQPLGEEGRRLQVGGVVLSIVPMGDTRPVLDVIRSPATPRALLEITWDAGQCVVRCGGQPLDLPPTASQLLGHLAESPGEIVHRWDLQQEIDSQYPAPHATAVRQALVAAAKRGLLDVDQLRAWRAEHVPDAPDTDSLEDLMLWVVRARRGHGYVLNVPAQAIVVRRI